MRRDEIDINKMIFNGRRHFSHRTKINGKHIHVILGKSWLGGSL